PLLLALGKRSSPLLKACFAVVDFLSSAHQGNNGGPVLVSFHDSQQHLGFRIVAIEFLLVLRTVPSTLSLIEDDGVIRRAPQVIFGVVPGKNMNVFYEGPGF